MNDIAHKQMVQQMIKKKFGRKKSITSKYVSKYPMQAEREYQRIIRVYMRLLKAELKANLPEITKAYKAEISSNTRQDDLSNFFGEIRKVFEKIALSLECSISTFGLRKKIAELGGLTEKIGVREWKKTVKKTLGLDLFDDYYKGEAYRKLLTKWIDNNVNLIETIPYNTLDAMREIVLGGYRKGESTASIGKKIQRQYDIEQNHAFFIARDQIAKLNGDITHQQQADAGIERYRWSTVRDSRVRDDHRRLEGHICSWNDPPIVDYKNGRRAHPGQDYQCRCCALAVFEYDKVDLPVSGGDEKNMNE